MMQGELESSNILFLNVIFFLIFNLILMLRVSSDLIRYSPYYYNP